MKEKKEKREIEEIGVKIVKGGKYDEGNEVERYTRCMWTKQARIGRGKGRR